MAGKRTIGIHLRGTDKVIEERIVSPERMVEEAFKYYEEGFQFLLATDEQQFIGRKAC